VKLGILGGTFNPIHYGHLRIAEEVRQEFGLERVLFMPAAVPPHKPLAGDLPFAERAAMVSLAIEGNRAFSLCDIEGRRGGTSWLIDTLRQLKSEFPADDLYFIMGSDSFADIGRWKEYGEYFSLVNLIVAERPGTSTRQLAATLPADLADVLAWDESGRRLLHSQGTSVSFYQGTLLDISSRDIRRLVASGRSLSYLVPDSVARFITEKRLYINAE
jgi:nicotinate-nucleotide adenylyltransferase